MADEQDRVYGGRYQLHRRIARGGMAEVYLARDSLLDRPVALKILFPEFSTDRAFVERFRREAQAAANLSHPNIVSVYDWGEEDGTYFIVMEYVEGRSLAQILHDDGALLPDRAADIATDIAAALAAAHRNGVIHRDVKPGNVLISPLGQVKVTDFGIARAISTQDNLTQAGTVMGTATYFSPEQARGEPVDPRSDVYSLGVVLYELLVGEPPFTGENPVSVAYKHVQEQVERPTQRSARVPAALEAITMKALAKNPANRYASADELAADLRRFRDGRPVLAEAMLPDEQHTAALAPATGDATRANPQVGGRTIAVPVTGGDWDDDAPPKRSATFLIVLGILLVILVAVLALFARNLGVGDKAAQVKVPRVIGLNQAQAQLQLERDGFDVTTTPGSDPTKDAGVVLGQTPGPGAKADKGSTVAIEVNAGQPLVDVPSVEGLSDTDANDKLVAAGLVADIQPQADDTTPVGQVISQDPAGGTQLAKGSTVELAVSTGPGDATVPDVTGLSQADAANKLGRAGFDTTFVDEPSSTVAKGMVTRTDPEHDTQISKGTKVTVYVSSGPSTVPEVLGLSADDASAQLQAAGFVVRRTTQATLDEAQDGLVIDQSPNGGSNAAPSSTVTITIGRFLGTSTTTSTPPTSTP